jgi:hypothetical protein
MLEAGALQLLENLATEGLSSLRGAAALRSGSTLRERSTLS